MSKASEWEERNRVVWTVRPEPFFSRRQDRSLMAIAEVTPTGDLLLTDYTTDTRTCIDSKDALDFAQWILDTFGEPTP